jgi:ribonuclease P protein subunit RPR2
MFLFLTRKHYETRTYISNNSCSKAGKNKVNSTTKQIARRRVQILFQQATQIYRQNPELAKNYLLSAKKIAMSSRMRLPVIYRRRICKNCNTLLVPGESSRVRTKPAREPHIVITCLKCGSQKRIPLRAKSKEKTEIEQNNNKNETSR